MGDGWGGKPVIVFECLSVVVDVGDRVRWGESKDDTFSVKAPYKALELESTGCFPMKIIWNSCVTKSKFLCLGGNMGKSSNLGPSLEEGVGFSKQMLFVSSAWGVHWPSSSPLQKNKGSVEAVL